MSLYVCSCDKQLVSTSFGNSIHRRIPRVRSFDVIFRFFQQLQIFIRVCAIFNMDYTRTSCWRFWLYSFLVVWMTIYGSSEILCPIEKYDRVFHESRRLGSKFNRGWLTLSWLNFAMFKHISGTHGIHLFQWENRFQLTTMCCWHNLKKWRCSWRQ
jgi:hypothetical protein